LAVASSHVPGQVRVWDVDAQKEVAALWEGGPPRFAHAVAFSPDGKTLASGGTDGAVRLWDLASFNEKALLGPEEARRLKGRLPPGALTIYSIAFSPDGQLLATGAGGALGAVGLERFKRLEDIPQQLVDRASVETGEVKVCGLATREPRVFFRGETGRIFRVCFSPDGKTLASAGRDGAIRLFDVTSGKERACLREGKLAVTCVAYSPDGKTLASLTGNTVKLWALPAGRVRARLKVRKTGFSALAYSHDGKTIATAASVLPPGIKNWGLATGEVQLWDAATGRPRGGPLTCRHQAERLAFGARGKLLAAAGRRGEANGEVTLWELAPGKE
jgi:WD40 repeat protein